MNKKVRILFFTLACMAYTSAALAMKKVKEGEAKVPSKKKFFLLCIHNPEFPKLMNAYRDKTVQKYKRNLVETHSITCLDNFNRDAKEMQKLNKAISKVKGKIIKEPVEGIFTIKVAPPQTEKTVRHLLMTSSYYVSKVVAGKKKRKSCLKKRKEFLNLLS